MPYTLYSVYVTAVRLIGDTGRLLEGMRSNVVTERTLAGGELKKLVIDACILDGEPECSQNQV